MSPPAPVLLALLAALAAAPAGAATLELQVRPTVAGEALQPASLRYQTTAGETFAITRVSWLACDFALQRADGTWLELGDTAAWFDAERGRDCVRLPVATTGEFRSLRFLAGLTPAVNHAGPDKFPAGHPLNPNLNGLHWSWQGGYIFLALEGLWRNAAGQLDGWAYHLARDTNAASVTLALPLVLTNETQVALDFDLGVVLRAPRPLSFAKDGSSTHSRDGDSVAAALVRNLAGAFSVRRVTPLTEGEIAAARPAPLYLPAKFTPYEFQIAANVPIPELPRDNPLTQERVALGRELFFDRAVSINDSQSCASCHAPEKAFSDSRQRSWGAEGGSGSRHSMRLLNLAWKREFFWDGRAPSLRAQVVQPIQNPIEMHQSLPALVEKLAGDPAYAPRFTAAFGSPEITAEKVALALENYLLTLTSFDSKFDRAMRGEGVLSAEEQRGFELFSTEYDPRRGQFGADCFHCHGGALFQSQGFANNGLDAESMDTGRADTTGRAADRGKFAVPSLRNVAVCGPYMHDGRLPTLEAVVEHYVSGVKRSETLDPNLAKHPDGGVPLSAADQRALVAFLRALTDPKVEQAGVK